MRIEAMLVMAGLAGMSARAGQVEETVTVYLSNTAIVPSQVMFVSQNLAARMFVRAGCGSYGAWAAQPISGRVATGPS
jgi:hypothetical protein